MKLLPIELLHALSKIISISFRKIRSHSSFGEYNVPVEHLSSSIQYLKSRNQIPVLEFGLSECGSLKNDMRWTLTVSTKCYLAYSLCSNDYPLY